MTVVDRSVECATTKGEHQKCMMKKWNNNANQTISQWQNKFRYGIRFWFMKQSFRFTMIENSNNSIHTAIHFECSNKKQRITFMTVPSLLLFDVFLSFSHCIKGGNEKKKKTQIKIYRKSTTTAALNLMQRQWWRVPQCWELNKRNENS